VFTKVTKWNRKMIFYQLDYKRDNRLNLQKITIMKNEESINPWKTLTSEKVHDSPWIGVTKHDVLNPNGNPGTYSVIHFKNMALGVLPLDKDYNTWIVGQYRYPINKYSWEIPEGGGKWDVAPLDSAKRELLEETGITAQKWTKIQEMYLSNSASDEFCILYIAQDITIGESQPEDDEQLDVRKLHFDELYKMVQNGDITDSLTVAAVLKTKLMLLEGKL
jgi:ADP-ribose pyrophosphatase